MAEFTVNFAIETLGSLLVQETKLLRSVKKEVESIKRELEFIRSFLTDADTRAAAEEEGGSDGGVVRSVSLFRVDRMPNSFMTTLVVDFKLIKVLDFEDSPIEYLPEGVGNLFHLHYLSVKNTKVNVLPKSIGRALEELRGAIHNDLRFAEGAKSQQQRFCGPAVAMTFNFLVSVGIILINKYVSSLATCLENIKRGSSLDHKDHITKMILQQISLYREGVKWLCYYQWCSISDDIRQRVIVVLSG
ncbi:hypothetical protein Patl1_03822 [Pistacia atlantica]|uniref:Uncharacterized protein n=1 Tax=Pistacia atlantica TaxID=434234 RepID=A0ACC1BP87_9ROSI|nr:hypothetical protein Patl1_03822 [Pistacia atlantica]